jgi:glucokinase
MSSRSVIGADLGGTKLAIVRYDAETWQPQQSTVVPTEADRGFPAVFETLIEQVEALRSADTVGIGIGVPGLVHQPDGHLLNAPNLPGARDVPLKAMLEERLKLPVALENDARSFTLAEALLGAGKGHRVVVGLTLGTGVGGGIVMDGGILHGENGYAGEIGHMLLVPGQAPFPAAERQGEAEQFLSGTALRKRGASADEPPASLAKEAAWLCLNLTYLLNPSVIVIGGGAAKAVTGRLEAVERELQSLVLPGIPLPQLAAAQLSDAGALGVALLALSAAEA